jgi:ubiquinone/menaquinone biosynthesis C-methylase UbiE
VTGNDKQMTADVTAAYTALAGTWDTAGAEWNQPVGNRLVELAGLAPHLHVLDVGCGAGAATIPAAHAVGTNGHVTAIDIAEPMLDRTERAAREAGLGNVAVQRADAAAPPFPAHSFDVVLASLMVYLLADPAAALQRWRELIRPGGILAFSWVLDEDPLWDAVYAAVDSYLPSGRQGWNEFWRRPPCNSAAGVEAMLGGYACVVATPEPVMTGTAARRTGGNPHGRKHPR